MAKRSARRLSKKGLIGLHKKREVVFDENKKPIKSRLARDENGNIIWEYKGNQYPTLRTVITKHYMDLLNLGV